MDNSRRDRIKHFVKEKLKNRKKVEGRPNIEGVSTPKKKKPKKRKEEHVKPQSPASVSIGAHGGRYIQEPSGHKRYVSEGALSGVKRFKKSLEQSIKDVLADVAKKTNK